MAKRRQTSDLVEPAIRVALERGRHAALTCGEGDPFLLYDTDLRSTWGRVRDRLLAEWAAAHPGTRPDGWWTFDAPEPRRRLGGIGTAAHECLNVALHLDRGIPSQWLDADDVETFAPIRASAGGPPFEGVAVDPADPPLYESEAAYLDRLGLFLPGEKRRVPAAAWQDARVLP